VGDIRHTSRRDFHVPLLYDVLLKNSGRSSLQINCRRRMETLSSRRIKGKIFLYLRIWDIKKKLAIKLGY
jgi:hypothetical protein